MEFYKTDRLVIRNVTEKDIPIIYDYRNNEQCARYQRGQVKTWDEIHDLVTKRQQDVISSTANCMLAVALKDTDELVGEIQGMPNDGSMTLGYTFSYRHHRMGYAYEALSMLVAQLHELYPDLEFVCFVDPENKASIALLKKLGYTHLLYSEKKASEVYGKWVTSL